MRLRLIGIEKVPLRDLITLAAPHDVGKMLSGYRPLVADLHGKEKLREPTGARTGFHADSEALNKGLADASLRMTTGIKVGRLR